MATVAAGQKFLGVASTVDTTEKRSKYHNDKSECYAIEDIQDLTAVDVVANSVTSNGKVVLAALEDVAASADISLDKAVSYFTTAAAEVSQLAAGAEGQIKYLCMTGNGGNAAHTMITTVTNAGWGSTLTFNAAGDACTLVYANAKWQVVGNNGVALA
jgi:hypothetical protein